MERHVGDEIVTPSASTKTVALNPGGSVFVYLWEYIVTPDHQTEFEREYGPRGGWVKLFSRGTGYLGTTLLRDRSRTNRYVTIDRWASKDRYDEFLASFRAEFEVLDARCDELTESERLMGRFDGPDRAA